MKRLATLLLACLLTTHVNAQLNIVSSSVIESTTTSATGTAFVGFAKVDAVQVRILNNTGTVIAVRLYNTGKAAPIPDATQLVLRGVSNANQLSVKRQDNSNTPVTIYYIIER